MEMVSILPSKAANVRHAVFTHPLLEIGDMRKFAFVTLEAPKAKIQQCEAILCCTAVRPNDIPC